MVRLPAETVHLESMDHQQDESLLMGAAVARLGHTKMQQVRQALQLAGHALRILRLQQRGRDARATRASLETA